MRRHRYTLADAAFEVLRLTNRPMHPVEIAQLAVANGLVKATSPGSMYAPIWREMRSSRTPRFAKTIEGYRLADGATAAPSASHAPPGTAASELAGPLKEQLAEIRRFLRGEIVGVDANRICIWLELCSLLDLHDEVVQLMMRIPEEGADPFLYGRARKLARASRMKVEG